MTTKRKADLQRRLSMASMPKPPEGLAERIKAGIPDLLATTTRERERFSRSMVLNMRVAASIILLVSSVYLCLRLLSASRMETAKMAEASAPATARPRIADGTPRVPQPLRETVQPTSPAMTETTAVAVQRLDESAPGANAARPAARKELADAREEKAAPARNEPASRIADTAPPPIPDFAPPPPPPVVPPPSATAAAAPAAPTPAARMPFPQPAPVPLPAVAAEKTRTAEMSRVFGGVVGGIAESITPPSAKAADMKLGAPAHVFGISTDPDAFEQVKDAIEGGERPRNVDVEALINYFAGGPRHAPREVSLDVEASPAPLNVGPHAFIIRTTIDTARAELATGSSVPPVATDARLEIELDSDAVVSHHRLGNESATAAVEPALLKNVSATALYSVELRPNLSWRQRVATVRLRYRSVDSGEQQTITRVVRASDFAHTWPAASRRHRLASLGAVWGETLRNAPGANDVAVRAAELANQEPKDVRARELATLASASSRLQSSAPTGSGR